MRQDDGEFAPPSLATTHPAHLIAQTESDLLEQRIAKVVTERVFTSLKRSRSMSMRPMVAPRSLAMSSLLQRIEETCDWQPGQSVMKGLVTERVHLCFAAVMSRRKRNPVREVPVLANGDQIRSSSNPSRQDGARSLPLRIFCSRMLELASRIDWWTLHDSRITGVCPIASSRSSPRRARRTPRSRTQCEDHGLDRRG